MSFDKKYALHLFDSRGYSVTRYNQLEKENAELKAQNDTLRRQVDMLLRRQIFFDASFDKPTQH